MNRPFQTYWNDTYLPNAHECVLPVFCLLLGTHLRNNCGLTFLAVHAKKAEVILDKVVDTTDNDQWWEIKLAGTKYLDNGVGMVRPAMVIQEFNQETSNYQSMLTGSFRFLDQYVYLGARFHLHRHNGLVAFRVKGVPKSTARKYATVTVENLMLKK